MTAVRPGSAPKTMPSATPIKLATRASMLQAELKADMNISNMGYRLLGKRDFEEDGEHGVQEG